MQGNSRSVPCDWGNWRPEEPRWNSVENGAGQSQYPQINYNNNYPLGDTQEEVAKVDALVRKIRIDEQGRGIFSHPFPPHSLIPRPDLDFQSLLEQTFSFEDETRDSGIGYSPNSTDNCHRNNWPRSEPVSVSAGHLKPNFLAANNQYLMCDSIRDNNPSQSLGISTPRWNPPSSTCPPASLKSLPSTSRTNLKQYLQREHLLQQEERRTQNAKSQSSTNNGSSDGTNGSSAVAVPTLNTSLLKVVPQEVLKVHTRLENPTYYHVFAERKRQVQEYIKTNHDEEEEVSVLTHSMPNAGAAPSPAPYISSSAPDSPQSVGLGSSAATSASEADVLEGIMQLQGELDSESNSYLPTSATSLLENLFQLKAKSTPTAKSCPPEMANINTFNVGHGEHFSRERIRKDNHNMIERRRRYNINDRIKELATLLPKSNDPHRQNKGTILKESVDYIRHMNKVKNNYESEVAERKRLENENKKLRLLTQLLMMNQVPQVEEVADMNSVFDTSLLVKQEPIDPVVIDQDLSTSTFDDIMEDDQHFVIRNPMMGCPDNTTDDMDFNS